MPSEWCERDVRQIVTPDKGTWWLRGDAEAIEARIAAAYTRDEEDLEAFARGDDLHTRTMCAMFKLPAPPVWSKAAINASPECEAWRREVQWGGESDRRRHACKSFRYAWQYAVDERGVLLVKDLHTLGLTPEEILSYARQYARAKPAFFAGRREHMNRCVLLRESRTFLGRKRALWGSPSRPAERREMMKHGWAHMVSGSVSDIVNIVVRDWWRAFNGESWLISNGYDSLEMGFLDTLKPDEVLPRVREIAERDWDVEGVTVRLPWSWSVVTP